MRHNGQPLTEARYRVLEQASRGLTVRESAAETWHSPETIKVLRMQLVRELQAKNLVHAMAIAYQRRILPIDGDA